MNAKLRITVATEKMMEIGIILLTNVEIEFIL